jgi:uncharacterized membrane protein (DUF485 family)
MPTPAASRQYPQNNYKKDQESAMTPNDIESICKHPDFQQLVKRKQRLNWSLTLAMLVIYYGFVLLVAFSPSTLGQSLSGGVTSVGMLVGVVIVLLSFALTGIYVYRANNVLDPLNDKVRQECAQ